MILILGGSGYVGGYLQRYLRKRGVDYLSVSRKNLDYTSRTHLLTLLEDTGAEFLINAAGYTGKPNVDACELNKAECLAGNVLLPAVVKEACEDVGLPWAHISSGCIYQGRRIDGKGFNEDDSPNFCFRSGDCSFYSGTKALGEEVLEGANCYIWRIRIPFDRMDSPRNYITKLRTYEKLLDADNSMTHMSEFPRVCLDAFLEEIPFGIYNATNPGSITTREVTKMMGGEFRFFEDERDFMKAVKTPRSNCVLDTSKLDRTGLGMKPIREAMKEAIHGI